MKIYSSYFSKGFYLSSPRLAQPITTTTMVAIARYRRFILLVVLCCISFFVFGWYTKVEEATGTLSEDEIKTPVQDLADDVEVFEPEERNPKKQFSKEVPPMSLENPFSKLIAEEEAMNRMGRNEASHRHGQNDDLDLFSGPTEEGFTFPYEKRTDSELEYSGPPPLFPFGRAIKPLDDDMEMMNSGPTEEEDFFAVTAPSKFNSESEMENSGPTEYSARKPTKSIKKFFQNKINSIKSKIGMYSEKSKLSNERETTSTTPLYAVTKPEKNPSLILDTPACKIPKLDPWDPTVIGLYEKQDPYQCPGLPLFLKSNPDGSITINETILMTYYNVTSMDNVSCFYQPIVRKHEEPGNVRENDYFTKNVTALISGVPLNEDYVAVQCNINDRSFEQYFPLVRLRPEIEDQRSFIPPPEPRLNVILAGIDSISKLNFLRHFPRTHAYLKEKLSPFEMNGYTKVGDNTFPNLVPLLTGRFVEHYWNESLRDTMYFDHLDLIWKDYAKRGYRTFYAEDSPYTGTFNYLKRGFYDPPTDYYSRPVMLALESSRVKEQSKQHCYNSQLETYLIYDYLRDFLQAMGERPHIAFAMVSTITHDYLNKAGYQDEPTVRLLEQLHTSGALNNSMLVLFGDHGLRFGAIRQTYIGKFEERMPFMYVHFPKWFLDQYPHIHKNLRDNQDRLITLFDVHATMLDLLNVNKEMSHEEKSSLTQGSSLMREISPNRTCDDANILAHWCPCQTFEEVDLKDNVTISAAQAMVDDINSKLSSYGTMCAVLEIDNISDARLGQANDLVMRFVRHDNVVVNRTVVLGEKVKPLGDYLITLTTKPGGAVFEGTVRRDAEHDSYTVMGISRINMYGNQSRCIDSQKMKIYCYCLGD